MYKKYYIFQYFEKYYYDIKYKTSQKSFILFSNSKKYVRISEKARRLT